MANVCQDLHRRCMRLQAWPKPDRRAWEAAISAGSLLADAGLAANWAAGTRARVVQSYGRFLTFLECRGELAPQKAPAERVSHPRVVAYVETLRREVAPVTVHGYVLNLERALHVMSPNTDLAWLKRMASRLKAQASPSRNKRLRVIPAELLFDAGMNLMQRTLEAEGLKAKRRAQLFRDGLMIAFLSKRPLRRRGFTNMEIGRQFVRSNGGYCLRLRPTDTKNRRAYETPFPESLVSYMHLYLEEMRPILLGKSCSDRLWISRNGTPLASDSIYQRLCRVTERELGRPINPHLFRDCTATSIAIDDPEHVVSVPPRGVIPAGAWAVRGAHV